MAKKINIEIKNGKLHWGLSSAPIGKGDLYMYSPAEKIMYIVTNGDTVTSYGAKKTDSTSYQYKDRKIIKMLQINGYAHIVYSHKEQADIEDFYQAKLLPNGYCTNIIAIYRRNEIGDALPFNEDGERTTGTN